MLFRSQELARFLGPVALDNLRAGLREMAVEIVQLCRAGFTFADVRKEGLPLAGKTFVITGTLLGGGRDAVSQRIEDAGGLVKGSVAKKVDYLVVGQDPGSNKTAAAAKCGTKILSEDDLFAMLGAPPPVAETELVEREF